MCIQIRKLFFKKKYGIFHLYFTILFLKNLIFFNFNLSNMEDAADFFNLIPLLNI